MDRRIIILNSFQNPTKIMKKAEKKDFVQGLTQELKGASSVVLVDYAGMSVSLQQDLKNKLRSVNARMVVVKNSLFKRAGGEVGYPAEALEDTVLAGPTAMIITQEDPIAPIQALSKFAKENELPTLKIGIVEGKYQDKNALEYLSKLPGKEVLLSQAVGAIGGPLYGLVGTLTGNMQKLIYVLDTKAKE